jgi:hypothetical protein
MGIKLGGEFLAAGGGFLQDVDKKIVLAEFCKYGFPTKEGVQTVTPPTTVFHLQIEMEPGKIRDEHYSVGGRYTKPDGTVVEKLKPTADGKGLDRTDPEDKKSQPSQESKYGIFIRMFQDALKDAGMDSEIVNEDISVLNGFICHFIQLPTPKGRNTKVDPGKRENTFAVVDKIVSAPGGGGAKSGGASDEVAQETLINILNAAPNKTLNIAQIAVKGFAALGSKPVPEKQAIVNRMKDAAFLKSFDGMLWTYDPAGGKVVGL